MFDRSMLEDIVSMTAFFNFSLSSESFMEQIYLSLPEFRSNIHKYFPKHIFTGTISSASPVIIYWGILNDFLISSHYKSVHNKGVLFYFFKNAFFHYSVFTLFPVFPQRQQPVSTQICSKPWSRGPGFLKVPIGA